MLISVFLARTVTFNVFATDVVMKKGHCTK